MKLNFGGNLYVARHGQTVWNTEHRYQGRTDSPLTPLGIKQAEEIADALKDKGIEVIISSPLGRAIETAQVIAGKIGITDIQTEHKMRERNYGCYEALTKKEIQELYPELADKDITHVWNDGPYEAESIADFEKRVLEGLEEIYKEYANKKVLLVCHSGNMRILNKYFREINSEKEFFDYYPDNCAIEVY